MHFMGDDLFESVGNNNCGVIKDKNNVRLEILNLIKIKTAGPVKATNRNSQSFFN